ncbi:E-selectin-like [Physella acuta]|uniref:E-selectin-like n=1 Tax=Physella acuta TaxID=109671 RepID=UPI0027DD89A2|nr:E-selectin-like [Physella acuta]
MYQTVTRIFVCLILCSLPQVSGTFCGPPPVVENSAWILPCKGDKYEVCHFTCDWGFKSKGKTYTTCEDDGLWSNPGACSILHCGELPTVYNGDWRRKCESTFGTICDFVCDQGYYLHGAGYFQCMFDGVNAYWASKGQCVAPQWSLLPTIFSIIYIIMCIELSMFMFRRILG